MWEYTSIRVRPDPGSKPKLIRDLTIQHLSVYFRFEGLLITKFNSISSEVHDQNNLIKWT